MSFETKYLHLKTNEFKIKPKLIDWKKVSSLSCCCCCKKGKPKTTPDLPFLFDSAIAGWVCLNMCVYVCLYATHLLLLEVNCLSLYFCFSTFISAASALLVVVCLCGFVTVVSINSAYCLLLFYGLCCCAYGDNEKQNLLNICICMRVWKKEKCFSDKRKTKLKLKRKTSNAKYYIILCVRRVF